MAQPATVLCTADSTHYAEATQQPRHSGAAMDNPFSLAGKRGLIIGIANASSIAYGCARYMRRLGAELSVTYLNEKAKHFVTPLADELGAMLVGPCDVRESGQLSGVFDTLRREWGELDFVLHSIAYAPKEDLHARVIDCSREGFAMAMDVSCHSFIRTARYAEPLLRENGTLLTVTFYGSEKVVDQYNLMGPVKAALESVTRYLAAELGTKGISCHAISPGPLMTRAASGIDRFDELMETVAARAPQGKLVTIDDVGAMAAYLVSDPAKAVTGSTVFVDAGFNIMV